MTLCTYLYVLKVLFPLCTSSRRFLGMLNTLETLPTSTCSIVLNTHCMLQTRLVGANMSNDILPC